MAVGKGVRVALIGAIAFVAVFLLSVAAYQITLKTMKSRILSALGPNSRIEKIQIGLFSVTINGVRIRGTSGWPATDVLRARRVIVVPHLRSMLSNNYKIQSITLGRPYLSVVRTTDEKFLVLPSLLTKKPKDDSGKAVTVDIKRIEVRSGTVEVHDAFIANPPMKITMERVRSTIRNVVAPTLTHSIDFKMSGDINGEYASDGRTKIEGTVDVKKIDASVKMELRAVDILVVQPYLIKSGEVGFRKGLVDLDLQADVKNGQLSGPGKLTLSELEIPSAGLLSGTTMGVPVEILERYLKDNGNRITVHFAVTGNIFNPKFTFTKELSNQVGRAVAEYLWRYYADSTKNLDNNWWNKTRENFGRALREILKEKK